MNKQPHTNLNDDFKLNSELIKEILRKEHRKLSWIASSLGVSGSLVNQMLGSDGRIPNSYTLERLAALLGVSEKALILPRPISPESH